MPRRLSRARSTSRHQSRSRTRSIEREQRKNNRTEHRSLISQLQQCDEKLKSANAEIFVLKTKNAALKTKNAAYKTELKRLGSNKVTPNTAGFEKTVSLMGGGRKYKSKRRKRRKRPKTKRHKHC